MKHSDASADPHTASPGIAQILHECALHRSPAIVLNLESKAVADAEFNTLRGKTIVLDAFSSEGASYPTGSLCSVAFLSGDCSRVFLASVLGSRERPAPEPFQLELETPTQIAACKGRIRYRVPVPKDSGLQVHVAAEGRTLPEARALNLSPTGILIEFAQAGDPHLPVGAALQVMLELGGARLELAGEVVRAHGQDYGISFRDVGAAESSDPPEQLRKMVRILERCWLRARISAADRGAEA
jgi:hypothetical protein